MKRIPIRPPPQRWNGQPVWAMEYWLWCNQLYNSIELAEVLRKVRGCNIYYSSGMWWEDNHAA